MRVGLVGAGVISHNHLPHLLRLGAEVRVYSEAGADELVAAHGGTVAASLDELLDWAQVVDLVSPTHTHYPLARQALQAGLDVICEKPLARTDEQAAELVSLAMRTRHHLYPNHVVRYFPAYASASSRRSATGGWASSRCCASTGRARSRSGRPGSPTWSYRAASCWT